MPISLIELCSRMDPARTTLVLGAGASVPSGAPTSVDLADDLWHKLAKSTAESSDLMETATVLERRYGRKDVVEVVRQNLIRLNPTGGLLGLPRFEWAQLFTTNFDQLVEKAYKKQGKGLATFRSNYDLSNRDSVGKTRLYKIHGCITQDRSLGDKASMLLTEDDYDNYGQFRQSLFASLQSALLNGDVLVIGQSLRDRHLSDLVKRILKAKSEGAPGWVYVLVYDKDDLRAPLLEDRGAKVAFGGVDQLVDQLAQGHRPVVSNQPEASDFPLPVEVISSVEDVSASKALAPNVVRMFNGGSATYADIKAGATFERLNAAELLALLREGRRPIVTVIGAAGVGKSTLCRQLLLNLESEGFRAWEHREDFPFRHEMWMKLEAELRQRSESGILFVDECTHALRSINQLVDYLSAIEEPALRLVLAANSAQWAPRVKSPNFFRNGELATLSTLVDPEIHSLINLVEFNSEIAALVHPSFKSLNRSSQFNSLRRKASADMFVCLKNIFANENLDTILLREFDEIDEPLQECYRYVAALEAVGMKVHRHLLIRMLSIAPEHITSLLAGLTGIVDEYDVDSRDGIFGWRTRHLVIARKIMEYKFSGVAEINELFRQIIENLNPAVLIERQSISYICDSDYGIGRVSDAALRLDLYRRLTEIAPGERVPWHRVIRELLSLDNPSPDDVEYAIRDAEAAVGSDAPISRYKVRLLMLRAQVTPGISKGDRMALLRRAYEVASENVARHSWDRHSYRMLCQVAIAMFEKGWDIHLIDEAINRARLAAQQICDPEMDRDIQRFESARSRA
jgi:NAD-dependent SIR2 family protein deacetylase